MCDLKSMVSLKFDVMVTQLENFCPVIENDNDFPILSAAVKNSHSIYDDCIFEFVAMADIKAMEQLLEDFLVFTNLKMLPT